MRESCYGSRSAPGFPPGKSGGLIEAPQVGVRGRVAVVFPPGKSGGLIEASADDATPLALRDIGFRRVNPAASLKHLVSGRVVRCVPFPPGKSGGLIEAPCRGGASRVGTRAEFPPGKSGGLIEAWYADLGDHAARCGTGFRRVNPAASLKLGPAAPSTAPRAFPPGKSGGLIEADQALHHRAVLLSFPPGKSGGLIEATNRHPVQVS